MMIDWSEYQNFTEDELRCKCGCGRAEMRPGFMYWLQTLRNHYGKPLVITSGYRCPEYNSRISVTGITGPHTTGCAADVLIHGVEAHKLLGLAMGIMFGIGVHQKGPIHKRFIHFDMCAQVGPRPWVWSY